MTRRLIACGFLAVAVCTATVACGERQSATPAADVITTAPLPPTTTASPTPAVPTRCNAAALKGEIKPTDAGAGNRYGKLLVTNSGAAPCTLNGYSGLQLQTADGKPIPTDLVREPNPGPKLVQLAPGATAAANLHWSTVPVGNEPADTACQPEAKKAAAIPPDETQPMSLAWDYGPVCGGGHMTISAFYAA